MAKIRYRYCLEAALIAALFATCFVYYGDFYQKNEKRFSFYQKYFFSAVNVYCLKDPDIRQYNSTTPELNERIDLTAVKCDPLGSSPKVKESYFNGWHDTHPVLSTLIGYNWRLLDFKWEALWPVAGSLAALGLVAFYLILRCFGVPWYAALLLFPATVPFEFFERNFFYLRDFSKVPFILLSFALLGLLFRPASATLRLCVLAGSTAIVVIGTGFRQDALVLMPVILAGAALTSSFHTRRANVLFLAELGTVALSFCAFSLTVDLLRSTQVAQLQGYPHFLVQGFADVFWAEAHSEVMGISFLTLYSDMLAWAAVDANSLAKVKYFAALDPTYTTSGVDLIAKYASLSAPDLIARVFQALSVISHHYWIIERVGTWILLLTALIALGQWRLGFFLIVAIVGLATAGSLQFSSRHSLHLIMLDRALLVIICTALIREACLEGLAYSGLKIRLAVGSIVTAAASLAILIFAAHLWQQTALSKLEGQLGKLPWLPSEAAYKLRYPGNAEFLLRFTLDPRKCDSTRAEAVMELEGQRVIRPLEMHGGAPRNIYFAVFDPEVEKVSVDIIPRTCVAEQAWGPLGDGTIPPLQFFDPQVALEKNTLGRLFRNLFSSFL